MALTITGRVFDIEQINEKVCKVIIQKQVRGEKVPMAFACLGKQRDVVIEKLKLKKKDKITANIDIKSRLYNGKWYTDVTMYNIELIPDKPKDKPEAQEELDFFAEGNVDFETGEVKEDDDLPF
jgi:hypothetical protein